MDRLILLQLIRKAAQAFWDEDILIFEKKVLVPFGLLDTSIAILIRIDDLDLIFKHADDGQGFGIVVDDTPVKPVVGIG